MNKHFFVRVKEKALELNDFLKKIEKISMRGLEDEYYDDDDSKSSKPAPRKNNVKVEDLRPQKPKDS